MLRISFMAAIAILLIVNFYLINENWSLRHNIKYLKSQNESLLYELDAMVDGIVDLDKKPIEEGPSAQSEKVFPGMMNAYKMQSIKAAGVRSVVLRGAIFQQVSYEGIIMNIELVVRNGDGSILVNTKVPTGVDFQSSAKIAALSVERYLQFDLSKKDLIFSITVSEDANLEAVDGQSAGAAMAVLLASVIQGKTINSDVVITGTVTPENEIGSVGMVYEKAIAAGNSGAEVFLVPKGQAVVNVENCDERTEGSVFYRTCQVETKPLNPITENQFAMKTVEVSYLDEALSFFHKK